nr:hypothetical protein [Saccharomonospora halophila]
MRNIPVLLDGYKLLVSEEPQVKMRENDKGEPEVVTDWQGATQYVVVLFAKPKAVDGRPAGKGSEIRVTLETEPHEEIPEGSRVELVNPRVSHWESELGGRTMSGLSWRATGVKFAG